jgi:hypothetical protein
MGHFHHFIAVAVSVIAAGAAAAAADPAARDFVTHHPTLAVYLPVVSAVIAAGYRAYRGTDAHP